MKIVLTNDDGIDAQGLAALARAADGLGELVVIAPAAEHSNCGHRVTTHAELRVERRGPARFAVHGTPADCVRLALHHLASDLALVVSGINHGGNLGADLWVSGTVAAAREAVLHGRRGIAVSHYRRSGLGVDWDAAAGWLRPVLAAAIAAPPAPGRMLNINLPHLDPGAPAPRAVRCPPDPSPLPLAFTGQDGSWLYSGNYHQRQRVPGSDVDVCFGGAIAVSELLL
jgi:5'-nucleotidase